MPHSLQVNAALLLVKLSEVFADIKTRKLNKIKIY